MLWSPVILFVLVCTASASSKHGFKDGKEYTYKVRSRTLAALDTQSKQYAGVLIEAHLIIQAVDKNELRAKISQPQYSQFHSRLENGWDSQIPLEHLSLQSLSLSGQPFEVKLKNGVVRDLVVDKDVPTWEVNLLKSIIGQLQVDLKGENAIKSKENQFPESGQPYGMFKVMEDSVGGKCEVLYDISPLPYSNLMTHMPNLRESGEIISVMKSKNYSNCDQRISYHFGINGRNKWEPGSNDNGKYLSRSSVSRVILRGSVKNYTIQSSVTINEIVLSPDQADKQGMVMSKMNLTLSEVKDISEQLAPPINPQSLGNLVYSYNDPVGSPSNRRPNKLNQRSKSHKDSSEESNSDSSDSTYNENEDNYLQPKPQLTQAPLNPMLAYSIGNKGNSIQKNNEEGVLRSAQSIAHEIGRDMKKSDGMFDENTLEKFVILTRLIRTMSAEQINHIQSNFVSGRQTPNNLPQDTEAQSAQNNAWAAFRDAVAQAGTGPALVNIKKWIQNRQIQGIEAENVIDAIGKSSRNPTPEYMDAFFELIKMEETKKQCDTAVLAFADLVRHAVVNKKSAHNRYPVHAFGKLFDKNSRNLQAKYFAYLAQELDSAISSGDSKKIQIHIAALGRTAHPRILSIFEPYLEGQKQVSHYQRLLMVISFDQLTAIYPKEVQPVLYKIYSNTADAHEIRTAAVFLLMKTQPPASMIQRMADFTNYDTNKHVNSAVKSVIESVAYENDGKYASNAAKAALPLLTPENYGPQYSKAIFKNFKHPETHTGMSLAAYYLGSDDTILPRGFAVSINPNIQGLKIPKIQWTNVVSSSRSLVEFLEKILSDEKNKNSSETEKEKKYSPENIAKLLDMHDFGAKQLEGFMVFNENTRNIFIAFDNHTLEQIPEKIKQLTEEMSQGMNFEESKFSNYEVTMSFPTETGLPVTFTLKTPSIINIKSTSKVEKSEYDSQKSFPILKSEIISGKVKLAVGVKIQKRLSFVTPFESQEYITGIDKDLQVYLPLRGEIKYDMTEMEASIKVQPADDEPEFKALQYKKQPFTSKYDIMSFRPVLSDKNTHVVHKSHAIPSQIELNHWSNRPTVQFNWESQSKHRTNSDRESRMEKRQNAFEAFQKLIREIFSLVYPNHPQKSEEYEKYSVKLTPNSNMSAELKLSYGSMKNAKNDSDKSNSSLDAKAPTLDENFNSNERKKKLLEEVSKNMNGNSHALDVDFQLNTGSLSYVKATAAVAKNSKDRKLRSLIHVSMKCMEDDDYYVSAGIEAKIPDVPAMDYEETLKAQTGVDIEAELHYGKGKEDDNSNNRMKIQGKAIQTEKRKNEIRESHEAQVCKKEIMLTGKKLSQECEKVNQRAVPADVAEFSVTLDKHLPVEFIVEAAVGYFEVLNQWHGESNDLKWDRKDKLEKNKIKMTVELHPKNDKADLGITTKHGKGVIKDFIIPEALRIPNSKSRSLLSMLLTRTCAIDKSEVKTFDGSRYPAQVGRCWHVVMTSYPKQDPDNPKSTKEVSNGMRISVLTREDDNGHKELKITLGGKEVDLKPSESRRVEVSIDGSKVDLSKKRFHEDSIDDRVVFELTELPDESVKVTSDEYGIRILYDGVRAQIQVGEKYRDSIRGLCGNNDGEPENDQQTPKGCILLKSEEFMSTYALTKDEQCMGPAVQNIEPAKKSECMYEFPRAGNVISEREAGRASKKNKDEGKEEEEAHEKCMQYRTRVQENQDDICFSKRPLPTCESTCTPAQVKLRMVEFYCMSRSSTSELIAEKVKSGTNPEISGRTTSKTVDLELPLKCKPK